MNNNMIGSDFMNTQSYRDFMRVNKGSGNLKIRAYAASEALPVAGINIIVSTMIDNQKVVFFRGVTDASGMVETLSLPAPELNLSNLDVPISVPYEIDAVMGNMERIYTVNMYDGICVVQNINFIPGGNNGN